MKSNTKIKSLQLSELDIEHIIYVRVNTKCITSYVRSDKYVHDESIQIAIVNRVSNKGRSFNASTINNVVGSWDDATNDIYILDETSKTLKQRRKLLKLYDAMQSGPAQMRVHQYIWQQKELTAKQMKNCNTLWRVV